MAAATPLSPDEAYYWVWARAPALGYYDHPPMVAWFIAAGTAIAGDGALGVRLLSPLAAALGSVLLAIGADRAFPLERPGIAAAAMLNATLAFGIGAVTMTPDTPLLLFWTFAAVALAAVARSGRGWPLAGVSAGLALLSKYTAVLIAPAALVWVLAARERRAWLARPAPWLAVLCAFILFLPVLIWNGGHDWVSFAKQGGRAGVFRPALALGYLGELIGGQVGLVTPILAALFACGTWVAVRRARDPAWGLLAALTVVPTLVFVEHALGDRVQANWPAVILPSAAIAAALLGSRWARWRVAGIALGLVVTMLVYVQGVAAPLPLPRRMDPTLMRLAGWPDFAASVAAEARAEGAAFVAADNYGIAAMLARDLPAGVPVLGVESRWAYFGLPPARIAGATGLLVRSARRSDAPVSAVWARIAPAGEVSRGRDGVIAEMYRTYRVTGRADAADPIVVLPRPRG